MGQGHGSVLAFWRFGNLACRRGSSTNYHAAEEKNVMNEQTVELIVCPCGEWGGGCACNDYHNDCADCADYFLLNCDCSKRLTTKLVKINKSDGYVVIIVPAEVLVEDGENEEGSITFVMSEADYEGMGGITSTKAHALWSFAGESGLAANRNYTLEYAYGFFKSIEQGGAGNVVEHIW